MVAFTCVVITPCYLGDGATKATSGISYVASSSGLVDSILLTR